MISGIPVTSVRTLTEAYALLAKRPSGLKVLAGGTDFMAQLNARVGLDRIGHVLDIWALSELRFIRREGPRLSIGALATYSDLMASPEVRGAFPALAEVSREVGAWAIQNRGTLGGNICNASPAGDTLPLLIAAGARFHLGGPRGEHSLAAEEFFVAYRKTGIAADELLLRVEVPVLDASHGEQLVYRKVGTRRAQSTSKTLLAVRATVEGVRLRAVRIGAGSVAPVPQRCRESERAVEGQGVDEGMIARARAAIDVDIRPIDDVRSTTEYRRKVTANLLERLLRRLSGRD
jgi:CO/xanthine dehydrogenase FAD-binding subunit